MPIAEVVRHPLITEKGTAQSAQGKYAFEVAPSANKEQIKEAVEALFKVKVVSVNVMNRQGKMKRMGRSQGMTHAWRKAVVTLRAGDKIQIIEGV
ncbi:MAG: 50S ribosomal protein L23 [Chloroflexi bacterium]|nr:50S ribosomal protein L23 [Chloroflexota bacterium]